MDEQHVQQTEKILGVLSQLSDKIDDIDQAIRGTTYNKESGIIPRLNAVEKKAAAHGRDINRVKIVGSFLLALGTFIGWIWDKLR